METFWQEFAQKLLLEAIPILVPVAIALIGKWVIETWQSIKDARPQLAFEIERAAKFAINAAEQVGLTGALSDLADSKLDYAIEVAEKWLASNNIKNIDLDLLRAAIEAELKEADFPHLQKFE